MLADQDHTALTKEIWEAESLAEKWWLDPSVLGYGQAERTWRIEWLRE
jgi:hypothetical protein